jgi:small subunit ribosomal protein S20
VAKRTASAKKQARAGARRTVRNRAARSSVKTLIVKARRSLGETSSSDSSDAQTSTVEALRALDRAAAKGILHPRNAARRKSRLARKLAQVAKTAPPPTAPAKGKKPPSKPAPAAAKKK